MIIRHRPSLGRVILSIFAAMLLITASAFAQPPYEKKSEITLKGPIQEVKAYPTVSGVEGTHLMLKDGKQRIEVFAGPTLFLKQMGATFAKGETIEVIGSKMEIRGISALLARKIKKGAKTFEFRDEQGTPLWTLGH